MKPLICMPTVELARYAQVYDHFNLMDKPTGSILVYPHGQSPAANRNIAIELALKHDCTHLLFVDDDIIVPQNLFYTLAKHDKDVVTGLYLMRSHPHQPIIFDFVNEKGECRHYYPKDGETGLIPIVNCGLGCVLIKTEVFRALEKPYIRLGELDRENWNDDIGFFNRVRAAGFKLYCDLDAQCGHICAATVYPLYRDGQWHTVYYSNGKTGVEFPALRPQEEPVGV